MLFWKFSIETYQVGSSHYGFLPWGRRPQMLYVRRQSFEIHQWTHPKKHRILGQIWASGRALSHQAKSLQADENWVEIHICYLPLQQPRRHRIILAQLIYLQHHCLSHLPHLPSWYSQHLTTCPSSTSISGGSCSHTFPITRGHRYRNLQPLISANGFGTLPVIGFNRCLSARWLSALTVGIDLNNPSVYG